MSSSHVSPPLSLRRHLVALGTVVMVLAASKVFSQQQYTDIRSLGTSNAISKPGPTTGDDLRRVFRSNRADFEKVLRDVRWPGNPDDIFRAVENGSFSEAQYPVGQTFEWMAVKKRGVAQATVPIRWAGADPFEAFEIRVESNGQMHRFVIPKACGNLALVDSSPIVPTIAPEPLRPTLRVQTPNQCTGANVTVNVSVANLPEGGRIELTMTRPSGQRETLNSTAAGGGYRWQGKLDDAGAYTFSASATDSGVRTPTVTERLNLEPCQPACNIQLTPPPMNPTPKAGKASVFIDICASAARVGTLTSKVVKVHHTPIDGHEQLVNTLTMDSACSSSFLLPEYGSYRFETTVTDDRGMTATCHAEYTIVKPEAKLEPFFTAFAGKERRVREHDVSTGQPAEEDALDTFLSGRCAPLVGATIGVAYPFAAGGAQVFGQGGVAINTRDGGNTSLFADVGIDKNFEGGFIGAGIGVWDFTHGDTVNGSVFLHGGFDINDRLQWNFEGRLFMSEFDEISNNYAVFAGIRYFWKR